MLAIENLRVDRGRTRVLQGVDLRVGRGEIVALIGANGAGKTSLLRTISGLLRPREGRILYTPEKGGEAIDIHQTPAERIVRLGISHCPEGRGIFSRLTVRENLLIGAYPRRDAHAIRKDYDRVCETFPILGERAGQKGGGLSGGEQEMLAVGRALMSRPGLLLLDEPSLGLGPMVVETLFEVLRDINDRGVTILLVEQNAVMALEFAHRGYVLEGGRVAMSGPAEKLAHDEKVRDAYLGA